MLKTLKMAETGAFKRAVLNNEVSKLSMVLYTYDGGTKAIKYASYESVKVTSSEQKHRAQPL